MTPAPELIALAAADMIAPIVDITFALPMTQGGARMRHLVIETQSH